MTALLASCRAVLVMRIQHRLSLTSLAACGCPAGSYEETHLLNPSEASRTYSSVLSSHEFSQLDSLHHSLAWIAGTNTQGQWMEIDASEPMYIVGVITQGRGNNIQQWVTKFRVEYQLGESKGENIRLPREFSMPYIRTEHVFVSPIFARYIRIIPLEWVSYIAMRAALLVKSCSSCIANAVSLESSTAENACECGADAYKSTSEFNTRAMLWFLSGRSCRLLHSKTCVYMAPRLYLTAQQDHLGAKAQ